MAKKYAELRKKMSKRARDASDQKLKGLLQEMPLHQLRAAQGLTQIQLAETLSVKQASISKIEHQTDMYVSTLRRFIEALGGSLVIVAQMPEGKIVIDQFSHDSADDVDSAEA